MFKSTRLLLGLLFPGLGAAQSPPPQRAVLVTGASSGIGRKVTERLASQGLFVYAGARVQRDLDELNAIKNVQGVRLDVTVPADIAAAVATVTKAGRGLHGVVNNAGVVVVAPLIEAEEKDLDFIFGVNVYGPYRITKAFAPDAALARSQQARSPTPPRRAHHALIYDEGSQRVLLTAGSTPIDSGQRFEFFNDLWAFDGTRWSSLPASGVKLSGIQLAVDTKRNRLVSFGGYSNGQSLADLRVLEPEGWRTLGEHSEMRAAEAGFVYDSRRDRFIAFGGSAGRGQAHGDTWEYDGTKWTKSTTTGPAARQGHVMVYDAQRGRTVVYGGSGSSPGPGQPPPRFRDTWEFDGVRWTQRQVSAPSPQAASGATYDTKRGRVILFGGVDSAGMNGETWAWNGTVWTKLSSTGPEPRAMGYLAYDKQRDRVVLFGGRKGWPNDLDDTWEFDGSAWRRVP